MIHTGSCHCGAVRLEVETAEDIEAYECNCSLCRRTGFLHLIVPASRFRLLSGGDVLTTYTFNTRTAKHLFCRICGVKAPKMHNPVYARITSSRGAQHPIIVVCVVGPDRHQRVVRLRTSFTVIHAETCRPALT